MQGKRMDAKGDYLFRSLRKHKFLPILCRPEMGKFSEETKGWWDLVSRLGFNHNAS